MYMPMPMPAPARRSWFARHKVLTGLGIVVALVVVGSAFGGGDEEAPAAVPTTAAPEATTKGSDATPKKKDEPAKKEEAAQGGAAAPGVGDAVRDGKFEFVVTKVADGGERIGTKSFGTKAQGRFVFVHVTVKNVGDAPQMFFSSAQPLFDAQGREFSSDTTAELYLDSADTIIGDINPGNSVTGTLVFDLPEDAQPASIELHDSLFSGGVSVRLG